MHWLKHNYECPSEESSIIWVHMKKKHYHHSKKMFLVFWEKVYLKILESE